MLNHDFFDYPNHVIQVQISEGQIHIVGVHIMRPQAICRVPFMRDL